MAYHEHKKTLAKFVKESIVESKAVYISSWSIDYGPIEFLSQPVITVTLSGDVRGTITLCGEANEKVMDVFHAISEAYRKHLERSKHESNRQDHE